MWKTGYPLLAGIDTHLVLNNPLQYGSWPKRFLALSVLQGEPTAGMAAHRALAGASPATQARQRLTAPAEAFTICGTAREENL